MELLCEDVGLLGGVQGYVVWKYRVLGEVVG